MRRRGKNLEELRVAACLRNQSVRVSLRAAVGTHQCSCGLATQVSENIGASRLLLPAPPFCFVLLNDRVRTFRESSSARPESHDTVKRAPSAEAILLKPCIQRHRLIYVETEIGMPFPLRLPWPWQRLLLLSLLLPRESEVHANPCAPVSPSSCAEVDTSNFYQETWSSQVDEEAWVCISDLGDHGHDLNEGEELGKEPTSWLRDRNDLNGNLITEDQERCGYEFSLRIPLQQIKSINRGSLNFNK